MNSLYQRLRELEPKTFEDLCFQIISERHPGANITRVNGVGGDKGVDIFEGSLADGPTIWQCKFFANGIRSPQKKQIKKSLRSATQHFQPKRWVLCVPTDLTINEHAWFQQQLVKEHGKRLEIGLFQGSQIVRELLHRRPIRNMFFPGAVLEPEELRSILSKTGEYTNRELEKLTLENVEQYLQRLRDRDARFDYQVIFVPHAENRSRTSLPGLIATVWDDSKQIEVFARDLEALRLDPPKLRFRVKGEGLKKLQEAIQSGTRVELGSNEFSNVESGFDFLLPVGRGLQPRALVLEPRLRGQSRQVLLNLVLGTGDLSVLYDRVTFAVSRPEPQQLRNRVELASIDEDLPFRVTITISAPAQGSRAQGSIAFDARLVGKEVRAVRKFVAAMMAVQESGHVGVWDVQCGKLLFDGHVSLEPFSYANASFLGLLTDVCDIADTFKVEIRFPAEVTDDDLAGIGLLSALIKGREAGLEVEGISCTIVKSGEREQAFLASLESEMMFQFQVDRIVPQPRIFGTDIDSGPCCIIAEHAVISDRDRVRREYMYANEGEGVVISFDLRSPVRVLLLAATSSAIDENGPMACKEGAVQ